MQRQADAIIRHFTATRMLHPLRRARAWEAQAAPLTTATADEVKAAFKRVRKAKAAVGRGGDPELYEMRWAHFINLLQAWLYGD